MLYFLIIVGSFGALLLIPDGPLGRGRMRCPRCSAWFEADELDAPCFCRGASIVLPDAPSLIETMP